MSEYAMYLRERQLWLLIRNCAASGPPSEEYDRIAWRKTSIREWRTLLGAGKFRLFSHFPLYHPSLQWLKTIWEVNNTKLEALLQPTLPLPRMRVWILSIWQIALCFICIGAARSFLCKFSTKMSMLRYLVWINMHAPWTESILNVIILRENGISGLGGVS